MHSSSNLLLLSFLAFITVSHSFAISDKNLVNINKINLEEVNDVGTLDIDNDEIAKSQIITRSSDDDEGFVLNIQAVGELIDKKSPLAGKLLRAAETTLYVCAPIIMVGQIVRQRFGAKSPPPPPSTPEKVPRKPKTSSSSTASSGRSLRLVRGGATNGVSPEPFVRPVAYAMIESLLQAGLLCGLLKGLLMLIDMNSASLSADAINGAMLATWFSIVFLSGFLSVLPGAWFTSLQLLNIDETLDQKWYSSLIKPKWNPPQWAFPIAWIPLKILQVFSLYTLWEALGKSDRNPLHPAVLSYIIYKCLGDTWNKVWFGRHQLTPAIAVIGVYWISLLSTCILFYKESPAAAYLLLPTLPWVTFASTLNAVIVKLNKPTRDIKQK